MAANLDRAESALTAVSDIAYVRAIDSSGNSVRISKADLASVLGARNEIEYKKVTIPGNGTYDIYNRNIGLLFICERKVVGVGCLIGYNYRTENQHIIYQDNSNAVSLTKDHSGTINIYKTQHGTTLTIQNLNNIGDSLELNLWLMGGA